MGIKSYQKTARYIAILIFSISPPTFGDTTNDTVDYFKGGVQLESYTDHYEHILALTENGWRITSQEVYETTSHRADGGIFQTARNFQYLLEKGKTTGICSVEGHIPGGFDKSVHYSIECWKPKKVASISNLSSLDLDEVKRFCYEKDKGEPNKCMALGGWRWGGNAWQK